MKLSGVAILVACGLGVVAGAEARLPRSHQAVAEFKREQPCPSTGRSRGACPGYIVDHVVPLCADGADVPANMQWQTVSDARAKDRRERAMCRARKP